jgi:hypothetical protein
MILRPASIFRGDCTYLAGTFCMCLTQIKKYADSTLSQFLYTVDGNPNNFEAVA